MRHRTTPTQRDAPGPVAACATPPAVREARPRDWAGLWRDVREILLLYTLSAVALAWVFPPYGLWPLAFVCLMPWTVATCRARRAWLVHWLSFLVGWAFFLVTLRWLMPVTGLGYAALAFYLALYWPLTAWAIRTARRHGISPIWSLPVVWVACELLRATVMTGFPWLFLAHGLYQQLPLIQICDLTGAYGVSFLAALVNGLLVMLVLRRWPAPHWRPTPRELWIAGGITAVLLAGTLVYGYYRLNQVDFEHDPALRGPRIAVVQHDFPLISSPPYGDHPYVVLASYLSLAAQAAREHPDLVALPETVWSAYQNIDFLEKREVISDVAPGSAEWGLVCHKAVSALARGDYAGVNEIIDVLGTSLQASSRARPADWKLPARLPHLPAEGGPPVTVLIGSVSIEQFPEATYPKLRTYNSALVYDRDGEQRRERYDKNHLVPFGEYVPFRDGWLRWHWLYRRLNKLSPFSRGGSIEYSLTPGRKLTVFKLPAEKGEHSFGTPICYEDATPYVIRNYVWEGPRPRDDSLSEAVWAYYRQVWDGPQRRVDFLVNISNDGWFLHAGELQQHLAICAFRAVENRVGIARAVNTGISGFIDPNGRIYSQRGPAVVDFDVQPVYLDHRTSLYARTGDVLAVTCLVLTVVLWLGAVFERWVLALRQRIAAWARRSGPAARARGLDADRGN